MTFSLEQLTINYLDQLWLEFSTEQQERAFPNAHDYSHEAARMRAYLNRLCLDILVPALQEEANFSQRPKVWPNAKTLPSIWEVVNGTAITLHKTRLVLVPSEAIDTEEFSVPQEWVDIPSFAADYYLAVQVNLEECWLRVWGFTTHRTLKTEGGYDASDRTYSLDGEDLFEDLNVMWIGKELCLEEKAEIQPLPTLSTNQAERLLAQLGQSSPYSPRLKVPFEQWGAILANDDNREQLYQRRSGKVPVLRTVVNNLSQWLQNQFEEKWQPLVDLVEEQEINFSFAGSGTRSRGDDEPHQPATTVRLGQMIDLGIQLAGNPLALVVHLTPQADEKRDILLQVYPGGGQTYLPPAVQLIVLDKSGEIFQECQSGSADHCIQRGFTGERGEPFSVKVALRESSVTEEFVI